VAANPELPYMGVAEYLAFERHSPVKHEYVDGHVYAMSGDTRAHSEIAVNIVAALRAHLRGGPCHVYNSDARVQVSARRHLYPDVSVSCDERDHADDGDAVAHPALVIEVLSQSTEAYDRGDKFDLYRSKESLREYVLVSATRMGVNVYRREDGGGWKLFPVAPGDEVALDSIGFRCPIDAFYEDVVLPEE